MRHALRLALCVVALVHLAAALAHAGSGAYEMERLLGRLIDAHGVSGFEGPVREAVIRELPRDVQHEVDPAGNLLVKFGSGAGSGGRGGTAAPPGRTLLFMAHLDELGFVVAGLDADGRLRVSPRGSFLPALFQGIAVTVETARGPVPGVVASGARPARDAAELRVELGTGTAEATRALGIAEGQAITPGKRFQRLHGQQACARGLDDRAGCAALVGAIRALAQRPPTDRTVIFAFTVEEEEGLKGALALRSQVKAEVVFAIDTFVTSDSPLEGDRYARVALGGGPAFRAMDGSYVAQPGEAGRLAAAARRAGVPLQVGVTAGNNEASVWAYLGARPIALGWPLRSSHSMVETIDLGDVVGLSELVVELARTYPF